MLELKQTQRLSPVLTQQLQQAIKLLQLSQLELIEKEPKEEPVEETTREESASEKDDVAEWLERYYLRAKRPSVARAQRLPRT